ncbi:dihydropteroate synthase [Candidatus Bathycorpusculum sp.]|uniref:dihydropteroate synthase n=1 Tax=Candidatus Bathycorpusculum sp. TaxID=2994959 RepID=UPI0028258C25|nr:dihydropteroate synthase [Candidatus Termitimicrobium sp.]MCL2431041.1 dihydropteroate synthase [Candidatus Termitimicrobium sp.]
MVYPKNLNEAEEEISKINHDHSIIQYMASKAVQLCMFVEDVPPFVADAIKQIIDDTGGNAVIQKGLVNGPLENTNILIIGNLNQINKTLIKLASQSEVLSDIGSKIQFATQSVEKKEPTYYCCGKHKLEIGKKTYIMGILNITADSFSGDGLLSEVPNTLLRETTDKSSDRLQINDRKSIIETACRRAEKMVADGADIIDVGGESTRPGYTAVNDREELDRILGVVERLTKTLKVPISVDTSKLYVVENVLKAGAHIINDVNGLLKEPKIAELAATYGAGVIAMHNPDSPIKGDIFSHITRSLRKSVDIAMNSGIKQESISLDPGIGFGKTLEQNLEVMRRLDELKCLGYPVLLGTSRKSMIGKILDLPVNNRLEGTAATVTLGVVKGVDFIRVHDVKEMHRVVKMSDAMIRRI